MNIRIPYLLAALLAAAAVMNTNSDKGVSAATSLTMQSIDGRKFNISKPSSKAMLISFWSTSCSICARDVPLLTELQGKYDSTDLEILAVSMQYDNPESIDEFIAAQSIGYPVAHDAGGKIAGAFPGVRFTPTSFLLNGNGAIVWRHTGKLNLTDVTEAVDNTLSTAVRLAAR